MVRPDRRPPPHEVVHSDHPDFSASGAPIEFILDTEAFSDAAAPQWSIFADFANSLTFEVSTETPDGRLLEVHSDLDTTPLTAVGGKRVVRLAKPVKEKATEEAALLLGDGDWALLIGARQRLAGSFEATDTKGRKLALTLDEDSSAALLGSPSALATERAREPVTVSLAPGSDPKLLAKRNGKGTKVNVKAKAKLAVAASGSAKKGLYLLKLKGDLETSGD